MIWWSVAGGLALLAVLAHFGERRLGARVDLDRVGPIDWRSVQLFAVAGSIVAISVAVHA